jgi:hypothetical protein
MINPRRAYRFSRNYYRDYNASKYSNIKIFNSIWTSIYDPCVWLRKFILEKKINRNENQ